MVRLLRRGGSDILDLTHYQLAAAATIALAISATPRFLVDQALSDIDRRASASLV